MNWPESGISGDVGELQITCLSTVEQTEVTLR